MKIDTPFFFFPLNTLALIVAIFHFYVHADPGLVEEDTQSMKVVLPVMALTAFFLYPLIWFRPNAWIWFAGGGNSKQAVSIFAYTVATHKFFLFLSFYVVGWLHPSAIADNFISSPVTALVCIMLFSFAAWLQGLVYAKIGADGVYYGFKLGRTVPW